MINSNFGASYHIDYSMWSFLPFWLLTKMDGYKDGMPDLPPFAAACLIIFSCIYIYLQSTDISLPPNFGMYNLSKSIDSRVAPYFTRVLQMASSSCFCHFFLRLGKQGWIWSSFKMLCRELQNVGLQQTHPVDLYCLYNVYLFCTLIQYL